MLKVCPPSVAPSGGSPMSFQLLCLTFQMLSLSRMSVRSGRLVFYTYNLLCLTSRVFAEGVHGALNEAVLKTVTPTAGPAISRVTEAPGAELVHQQLAKKALNLCTQWSVVGCNEKSSAELVE